MLNWKEGTHVRIRADSSGKVRHGILLRIIESSGRLGRLFLVRSKGKVLQLFRTELSRSRLQPVRGQYHDKSLRTGRGPRGPVHRK